MKQFSCASIGIECGAVLSAPTEERLAEVVAIHAREAHGITEVSQEMIGKIKQSMINRSAPDAALVVDRIFEKYNCDGDPECTWRYIVEAEAILTGRKSVHSKEIKAA